MQLSKNYVLSIYCSNIDASTNVITLASWVADNAIPGNIYAQTGNTIARGFISKLSFSSAPEIPPELIEQKIYYLRKTGTNVQNQTLVKVYLTYTDAKLQTNEINFENSATGNLLSVYFPDFPYRYLNGWAPAAPTLQDIPCCPHVPAVYTNCPNLGSIVYDGSTRILKNFCHVPNGGEQTYKLGSLNSETFTVQFNKPFTSELKTWNVSIQQFFSNYRPDRGLTNPGLILYFVNADVGSYQLFYQASANTFPTTTYTQHWDGGEEQFFNANAVMQAAGLIPSTLSVTFSGQTLPPPHIRVSLPDAYFENYTLTYVLGSNGYEQVKTDKAINLGFIDEILTYNPDTLTYWSDLKTYAGIPGRIHFSIPNFYPLTSSGIQFIDSGIKYENQLLNTSILYPLGSFPNEMLNTFNNNEFNFYNTFAFEHIPVNELFGQSNWLRLFTSRDDYEGYPTGLPLGQTWFDSRVIRNVNLANPIYASYGPDFVTRKSKKIAIAFSRWGSAKHKRTNEPLIEQQGAVTSFNHYHQNIFYIKSVHPDAYITSLGI